MKSTRVFQLTALVLVLISVVQVGWWVIALRDFIIAKTQESEQFYAERSDYRAGAARQRSFGGGREGAPAACADRWRESVARSQK